MTCILLLRHGHVAGIMPKRFRGQLDIPLSEQGRIQAQRAADYVARRYSPQAVYSSPLQRCRDTAAALTTRLALPEPTVQQGLTDIHYGLWQGRLATQIAAEEPERYALWQQSPQAMTFPEGETLAVVATRASATLLALARSHEGRTIAICSHDSVIRVLLLQALGAPFTGYHRIEVDPCSLSELHCESGAIEVVRFNERTAD
jgi:probable phosphoglycerate mutase